MIRRVIPHSVPTVRTPRRRVVFLLNGVPTGPTATPALTYNDWNDRCRDDRQARLLRPRAGRLRRGRCRLGLAPVPRAAGPGMGVRQARRRPVPDDQPFQEG